MEYIYDLTACFLRRNAVRIPCAVRELGQRDDVAESSKWIEYIFPHIYSTYTKLSRTINACYFTLL